MKKNVPIAMYTDIAALAAEKSLLENKRFVYSVVIPLVGGVISYGIIGTSMITYDIIAKLFY